MGCHMLVLTRGVLEEMLIAENIRITVLEIGGNRVRLGISAPRDVPVMRAEQADERREVVLPLSRCLTPRPARKAG